VSTIKTDALTSVTTNTDLTLSANGTGGVKVSDYFQLTKGADISSATSLTLGTDGNAFDITGTTTITSIATQGIGSHVTLHFDGALTFTHHSTDLILPGAANITTAAGDIAVMYEYASADWRCVSYTKASGAAVVVASAGGFTLGTEQATTSGSSITFSSIPSGTTMIVIMFEGFSADANEHLEMRIGDSGGLETSGYIGSAITLPASSSISGGVVRTDSFAIAETITSAGIFNGTAILNLKDSTNFTWIMNSSGEAKTSYFNMGAGAKSLTAELTQLSIFSDATFDAGSINIMYQ